MAESRLSSRQFRRVCGHFATGVTVLLTETTEAIEGMTANAFMSVSLNPLLVSVAVRGGGRMAHLLSSPGARFSLSVLGSHQRTVAEFYSRKGAQLDRRQPWGLRRIAGRHWAVLGSQAWLSCRVESFQPAGDHGLILAEVEDGDLNSDITPLIFYGGQYWEYLESEPALERRLFEL